MITPILFPLILTTGRILSQYNVGAQTRRTANSLWHPEDVLEIHPFDETNTRIRPEKLARMIDGVTRMADLLSEAR